MQTVILHLIMIVMLIVNLVIRAIDDCHKDNKKHPHKIPPITTTDIFNKNVPFQHNYVKQITKIRFFTFTFLSFFVSTSFPLPCVPITRFWLRYHQFPELPIYHMQMAIAISTFLVFYQRRRETDMWFAVYPAFERALGFDADERVNFARISFPLLLIFLPLLQLFIRFTFIFYFFLSSGLTSGFVLILENGSKGFLLLWGETSLNSTSASASSYDETLQTQRSLIKFCELINME